MEKETISLKKLYELIDEYKTVSVVGESVQIISTPVDNGGKRELTVRLEGSTTSAQKIFVFDDGNLYDKAILPSIISYVSGSKGFEGFDARYDAVAFYDTEDGVEVLVNSSDQTVFDIIETSCSLISNKTEYKKVEKNDNYYMWDNILRYVNGRMYQIDPKGVNLTDKDRERMSELVKTISEDNFDKDKHVFTTNKEETTNRVRALLEDKEKLSALGFDSEFLNKINPEMNVGTLSELIINERKLSNFLQKRQDKEEVLSRVEFAKSQLNGMKANYFKCKDRVAAVNGLIAEYRTSDAYTDEQKVKCTQYCEELLAYMGVVKSDSNIVTMSPINIGEALAATTREYDFDKYEDMLEVYENLRETLVENEKIDVRFVESSDPNKVLIRLSTYNEKISDIKRDSYVFAFDKDYDRDLIRYILGEDAAQLGLPLPQGKNKSAERYDVIDDYLAMGYFFLDNPISDLDIEASKSLDNSKYIIKVKGENKEKTFAFSVATFNGKLIREALGSEISDNLGITDNGITPPEREVIKYPAFRAKYEEMSKQPGVNVKVLSVDSEESYYIELSSTESESCIYEFKIKDFKGKEIIDLLGQDLADELGIHETSIDVSKQSVEDYGPYSDLIKYIRQSSGDVLFRTGLTEEKDQYLINVSTERGDITFSYPVDTFDGTIIRGALGDEISDRIGITETGINLEKQIEDNIVPYENDYTLFRNTYAISTADSEFDMQVLDKGDKDKYYILMKDSEKHVVFSFDAATFNGKEIKSILTKKEAMKLGIVDDAIIPKDVLEKMNTAKEEAYVSFDADYSICSRDPDFNVELLKSYDDGKIFMRMSGFGEKHYYVFDLYTFEPEKIRRVIGADKYDEIGLSDLVKEETKDNNWFDTYISLWDNYELAEVNGMVKVVDKATNKPVDTMDGVKQAIALANIWGATVGYGRNQEEEKESRELFTAFDNLMSAGPITDDTFEKAKGLFTFFLGDYGITTYDELFGRPTFKDFIIQYYQNTNITHADVDSHYSAFRSRLSDRLRDPSGDSYWSDFDSYRLYPGINRDVDYANQDLFNSLSSIIYGNNIGISNEEMTKRINEYRGAFIYRSALIKDFDNKYLIENYLEERCDLTPGFISPSSRKILEMPPENLREYGKKYIEYIELSQIKEIGKLTLEENSRYVRLVINNPYARLSEYVKEAVCCGVLGKNTARFIDATIQRNICSEFVNADVREVLNYLVLVEKSRRVGLTNEENALVEDLNNNAYYAELSDCITSDYESMNNISYSDILNDWGDNYANVMTMKNITDKYALDDFGNIIDKETGNYYTPASKKDLEIVFSCKWFANVCSDISPDNDTLIQLFGNYAEHFVGKEPNFNVFRKLVRDAGLTVDNEKLNKLQSEESHLMDMALDIKGYTGYEKEHGKVYVDIEKLAGIDGIESADCDLDDKRMRRLIDYKFPDRYQHSTAYYSKYADAMCRTLNVITRTIKSQVLEGTEDIDARKIYKKFPVCSRERKYARKLLATDEDVQTITEITINKYHLDQEPTVVNTLPVETAVAGMRMSA